MLNINPILNRNCIVSESSYSRRNRPTPLKSRTKMYNMRTFALFAYIIIGTCRQRREPSNDQKSGHSHVGLGAYCYFVAKFQNIFPESKFQQGRKGHRKEGRLLSDPTHIDPTALQHRPTAHPRRGGSPVHLSYTQTCAH